MKVVLAAALLVGATTFAMAVGEKITVKYDLGAENHKWKFVAGQWVRRASGGRQVLVQTVETQPWAVAVLEDQKFADVDVSVSFRPVSGKEDASGGIIFRARDGRNYFLVRANALENNFRLYTIVNGKRSTIASARVEEPKLGRGTRSAWSPRDPGFKPTWTTRPCSTIRTRPSPKAGSGCGPRPIPSPSSPTSRSAEIGRAHV